MARKTGLIVLLAMAFIVGASSRVLTADADLTSQQTAGRQLSDETKEHQRILAELETVHQLRERMLQEGKLQVWCMSSTSVFEKSRV